MATMNMTDFSKNLMTVSDKLSKQFEQLRTRDELYALIERLHGTVRELGEANKKGADLYGDPQIVALLDKISRFLAAALPDQPVNIPNPIAGKKEFDRVIQELEKMAPLLKTQEQADETFFSLLAEEYRSFKNSEDFIRRLVIRRLKEISPEFLYRKGQNGEAPEPVDLEETNEAGEYVVSTRLLILKQFVKQFGWCEGVKHSERHADGEDYTCLRLQYMIEKSGKGFREFAEDMEESIFDSLKKIRDVDFSAAETGAEQWSYFTKYLTLLYIEDPGLRKSGMILSNHVRMLEANLRYLSALISDCFGEDAGEILRPESSENAAGLALRYIAALPEERIAAVTDALRNELAGSALPETVREHLELFAELQKRYGGVVRLLNNRFTIAQAAKNKSAIVDAAETMAAAAFGTVSSTRQDLYVFAIAFEMTLSGTGKLPSEGDEDYNTDIAKNLFYDYYSDNVLNALLCGDEGAAGQNNQPAQENVSGYGINYKNYSEVCFLYFIRKKDLSALEKLASARGMIEECKRSPEAKNYADLETANDDVRKTEIYRINFFRNLLSLPAEEFKAFLLKHYECKGSNVREDQLSAERRTATELFEAMLSEIEKEPDAAFSLPVIPEDNRYAGDFRRIMRTVESYFESMRSLGKVWTRTERVFAAFNYLLYQKNCGIECSADEFFQKINEELDRRKVGGDQRVHVNYKDDLLVNRFDLIIAACRYLLATPEKQRRACAKPISYTDDFARFYEFCTTQAVFPGYVGLNQMLYDCGFLVINQKSLFDLITLYYTFRNLHRTEPV